MDKNIVHLSIIIPIYNAQKYLNRTIESVINQTFTSFELILVNDGSTDNSELICKQWAQNDARVRYIYQLNSGVTSARATGLSVASGYWVMFCDSDDILPLNSIELLMKKSSYDIVIGKIKNFSDDKSIDRISRQNNSISVIDNICFVRRLLNSTSLLLSSPCAKLYKRSLFYNGIMSIPRNIVRGEDFIMNFRYAMNAKKICYINNDVYYYRQHNQSAIHSFKTTWGYEKEFLSVLVSSIANNEIFDVLKPDIMRCVIRSIGNAYLDTTLNKRNPDYIDIKKKAAKMHLGVMEYVTLNIIYFPPALRYFLFRICRKIVFYMHKLKK